MEYCDWSMHRWQKGISRYYKVWIHRDMLGDLILTKIWGGLNNNHDNVKHYVCKDIQEAETILKDISVRREKRGYIKTLN